MRTCPYCGDGPEAVGTVNHIECVEKLQAEIKRLRGLLAGLAEAYRVACILETPDEETDHGFPLDPRFLAARDELRRDS